jgi:hypothetical protein
MPKSKQERVESLSCMYISGEGGSINKERVKEAGE